MIRRILSFGCSTLFRGLVGLGIYISALTVGDRVSNSFSAQTNSRAELNSWVDEEIRNLGIERKVVLDASLGRTSAEKQPDGSYKVSIGSWSKYGVKHELYHVADGHCDLDPSHFNYLFYAEPQAILYGALGVKL